MEVGVASFSFAARPLAVGMLRAAEALAVPKPTLGEQDDHQVWRTDWRAQRFDRQSDASGTLVPWVNPPPVRASGGAEHR